MRSLAALFAMSLLAVALSGCSDTGGGSDLLAPEETDSLDAGNQTAEPTVSLNNTAPVAGLTASLLNGTAPLNVTFTLEGSDADGDNVTWTFDGGDGNTTANGTSLPATVNATYGVGNWTATLRVSDGQNETVQTLLVTVAPGAPAADPYVQHIEGAFDFGGNGCINNAYPNAAHTGPFYLATPDAQTVGKPFTAVFSATGPTTSYSLHFWKGGSPAGLFQSTESTVTGEVPDADTVYFNACGGLLVEFVYDAGDI